MSDLVKGKIEKKFSLCFQTNLNVSHGRNRIVVGLERNLFESLPLDHLEAVEVGDELVTRLQVGGQAHRDLGVVEVANVHLVVNLEAGAVGSWKR